MRSIFSVLSLLGAVALRASADPSDSLSGDALNSVLQNKNKDTTVMFNWPDSTIGGWTNKFDATQNIWPDIDYTAGCDARRANWPAQQHFQRALGLAGVWYADNSRSDLLDIVGKAMDYWFQNDYKPDDCILYGGMDGKQCPCGTPGLWNSNWFDQMILMPRLIGNVCLMLAERGELQKVQSRMDGCQRTLSRAYSNINADVPTVGLMTGSNLLDVSTAGLALGLLNNNASMVQEAYSRFFSELNIPTNTTGDGIKPDGSYMQHNAQLYTGNYGKDYINSIVRMLTITADTSMTISDDAKTAFETLIDGTEWMIIADVRNGTLLWQYNTIGRMVSFAASNKQASGGVNVNFTNVASVTKDWSNNKTFADVAQRLTAPAKTANQGPLKGVRYFYDSEYMVYRAENYVVTLKMYSNRTTNSECNNNQNPYGFHLSDGSIFTYLNGDEYADVFGVYDWDQIPGTTVDLNGTELSCNFTQWQGVEPFVGGVTHDDQVGLAVMNFTNPMTQKLHWSKTYFFFPGSYAVQVMDVQSTADKSVVVTTLDQRQHNGTVWVAKKENTNGQPVSDEYNGSAQRLWHARVGYTFMDDETSLNVKIDRRQGNWSTIGISTEMDDKDMFMASIQNQQESYAYVVQPGISSSEFRKQDELPIELCQGDSPVVRGAYSAKHKITALAFWTAGEHETPWNLKVKTDSPILVILERQDDDYHWKVSVSDPTQKLAKVQLTVTPGALTPSVVVFDLPTGLNVGSTVSHHITY